MGISIPTLPLANKYTKDTTIGMGAIKGAAAQFGTPTPATKEGKSGHIVPLIYEDNEGEQHIDNSLFIADGRDGTPGTDGDDGVGIASIEKTSTSGNIDTYTITLTNGSSASFTVTNGKNGKDGKDGTPIYNWTSGESYNVGDLIIRDNKWYQCDIANDDIVFDPSKWHRIAVEGGESELSTNVTANLTVGAISSGTTIAEGTTFTEFVQKILVSEIAPAISFSLSKSGNVVYGGSYTEVLTVSVSNMGTAKKINKIKWYEGNTLVHEDTIDSTVTGNWTYTMETATSDTTTFKAVVTYTKSDDATTDVTKTASINFYYNKFYGAVESLTPTEGAVESLSTALGTSKGGTYSFTVSAGRIAYAYPSSLGALTSIKDGNGFSLFNSFTRTSVTYTQNGVQVEYYLYVLTDATTVSGYSVTFA